MTDIYKNITVANFPHVMGILNVTPDSFSDGGRYLDHNVALKHADQMISEGADIIDVGGESTRPGAREVSISEETERVIPIIADIRKKYPNISISIDTRKSEVAEKALMAGANIINDISAGGYDQNIINVAASYNVPYVLMHIKGSPENMQNNPHYVDVVPEIFEYFEEKIDFVKSCGVNSIILDPGIGFGKRVEDNYEILNKLDVFKSLNYPLLVGISKKSFLGKSLNLDIEERENSTVIAETISALKGTKIIRTHNVKNAVQIKVIMSHLIKSEISPNV